LGHLFDPELLDQASFRCETVERDKLLSEWLKLECHGFSPNWPHVEAVAVIGTAALTITAPKPV
jgi:hypothetical protein